MTELPSATKHDGRAACCRHRSGVRQLLRAALLRHHQTTVLVGTGEKNYPWATRMTNTYDIGLLDAITDDEYLSTLSEWLPRLFERHHPQLAFFQAGVDAMVKDSFGRWVTWFTSRAY